MEREKRIWGGLFRQGCLGMRGKRAALLGINEGEEKKKMGWWAGAGREEMEVRGEEEEREGRGGEGDDIYIKYWFL